MDSNQEPAGIQPGRPASAEVIELRPSTWAGPGAASEAETA